MKISKFKIITIFLIVTFLLLALTGGANRLGYCVPEFRKLSDDELYERSMRNYMNYLVSGRNNIPVSRTDPDVVFYPDSGRAGRFRYPIWIINEQLTTEKYNERIYQYGKTDVAQSDRNRFAKIMAFLNAKTVIDGLSPTLQFAQYNNNVSFLPIINTGIRFYPFNCCYIGGVNEMKKYKDRYRDLYVDYMRTPKLRKPKWKPYTGWNERFLIMQEGTTQSSIQQTNGRKINRMDVDYVDVVFFPLSNCGKIDHKYSLIQ